MFNKTRDGEMLQWLRALDKHEEGPEFKSPIPT